jgi:Tol biopolymer transport system component
VAILLIRTGTHYGQNKQTFSIPESVLLFGIYENLRFVAQDRVLNIRPPVEEGYNSAYFVYPTLSPKGDFVAWGFAVAFQKERRVNQASFVLGLYSIQEQQWKTYGDFGDIGTPAFSPDGKTVAFVAIDRTRGYHFFTFDIATEKLTIVAKVDAKGNQQIGGIPEKASLSWSPDGKQIVVELQKLERSPLVAILAPATGEVRPLAEGTYPAWSPTGEWIAYYDPPGEKCMLIRPDGTGKKVVRKVRSSFFHPKRYGYAVVWSPDGKELLLNEVNGLRAVDVVLLDLDTGRLTTKNTENGLAAFGWAARSK